MRTSAISNDLLNENSVLKGSSDKRISKMSNNDNDIVNGEKTGHRMCQPDQTRFALSRKQHVIQIRYQCPKKAFFACALGSTRGSMHAGSLQNGSKHEGEPCLKSLVLGYPLGPAAHLQVADLILSLKNVRHMAVTVTNWNDGHVSQDSLAFSFVIG